MIAVSLRQDVVLAGVVIPSHRTLEVVDEIPPDDGDEQRRFLSAGQARALVQAGYAEPIEADFDRLQAVIDDWQRA